MKSAIVIMLSLTLSIAVVESTSCAANYCDMVRCANVQPEDCQPGTKWVARYGMCGCCSGCNKLLQYGEECVGIPGATSVCDEGLVCTKLTQKSRKTRCGFSHQFY